MSCKPIVKLAYGVKKPKQTSIAEVETWAAEQGYAVDGSLYLSEEGIAQRYADGFGNNMQAYTREGYLIPFLVDGDTITCSAVMDRFVMHLSPDETYPTERHRTLTTDLQGTMTRAQTPFDVSMLPPADFYIVGNWASYMGKLNELNEWDELVAANQRARVHLIKVNCDFLYPMPAIEERVKQLKMEGR